jgi:TfoX N-terminal domain
VAYDEGLSQRIREILEDTIAFTEKKMFGGLAFMVCGNMCVGVLGDSLMARIGKERYSELLSRKSVREMDFTGKPMPGYVFVGPEGIADDRALRDWVDLCLQFNRTLPRK